MRPTGLLPFRRKACWGFFRPKNPTASAGCEPVNLSTKGQHATSRPSKPLPASGVTVTWTHHGLLENAIQATLGLFFAVLLGLYDLEWFSSHNLSFCLPDVHVKDSVSIVLFCALTTCDFLAGCRQTLALLWYIRNVNSSCLSYWLFIRASMW